MLATKRPYLLLDAGGTLVYSDAILLARAASRHACDVVDVLGANAAGIPALHLDPLGLCAEWPGMRAKDLGAFADLLVSGRLDLRDAGLDPFSAGGELASCTLVAGRTVTGAPPHR